VVGSPTPLSEYFYITYEDSQSIQYKAQIIIEKSYGGIAMSDLTDGCDDIVHAINAIFPVPGFSPPPEPESEPYSSKGFPFIIIIVVIIFVIIICGAGGTTYYVREVRVRRTEITTTEIVYR
jgi:hypothetical protein